MTEKSAVAANGNGNSVVGFMKVVAFAIGGIGTVVAIMESQVRPLEQRIGHLEARFKEIEGVGTQTTRLDERVNSLREQFEANTLNRNEQIKELDTKLQIEIRAQGDVRLEQANQTEALLSRLAQESHEALANHSNSQVRISVLEEWKKAQEAKAKQ